jgi:hypothetical protein
MKVIRPLVSKREKMLARSRWAAGKWVKWDITPPVIAVPDGYRSHHGYRRAYLGISPRLVEFPTLAPLQPVLAERQRWYR